MKQKNETDLSACNILIMQYCLDKYEAIDLFIRTLKNSKYI